MKLSDLLEKEEMVLRDIIYHLRQTKGSLMTYTKLYNKEFDSEMDDMISVFGNGSIEESIDLETDGENQLYRMMSQIDSWILSLRRIHMEKGKEKKNVFSDDEIEKDTIYRVKDDDENTDGGK